MYVPLRPSTSGVGIGGTSPVSSGYPRTISPGLRGRSCGFEGGLPLPSTAGWPIPSLKPNDVRPVGSW